MCCVGLFCPLVYPLSIFRSRLSVVLGISVSGQNVLAIAREAGADMTDAVNRCVALTSREKHKNGNMNSAIIHFLISAINVLCTHFEKCQGQ